MAMQPRFLRSVRWMYQLPSDALNAEAPLRLLIVLIWNRKSPETLNCTCIDGVVYCEPIP